MTDRRLLLVGDADSPHVIRWIRPLEQLGWTVALCGFGDRAPREAQFFSLGPRRGDLGFGMALPPFTRIVRKYRPRVVHAHFVASYGVLAMLGSWRTPIVMSAWGSDVLAPSDRPRWVRSLVARALQRAAIVTFDAQAVSDSIALIAPEAKKVRLVFGPEEVWTTAPRMERPTILSPRRPGEIYQVESIVRAFGVVQATLPDWELKVAMWGERPPAVLEALEAVETGGRVHQLPLLDRKALREVNLAAAVFCSVPEHDATSVSVLEGMAAGAFPILSDLPANREWVRPGENGLLVRSGDVRQTAEALEEACGDDALRERARAENRSLIRRAATFEGAVERLDSVYRSLT